MQLSEYFKVISTNDHVLHFELKNFWDKKFTEELGATFFAEFKNAVDSFDKEKFIALADLSGFGVPSNEAKEYIGKGMKYALENNLYKSVEIIPKTISKMGIDQAAKKSVQDDFRVVSKDKSDALRIVEDLKREI
ncbi:MAG: hypothetical protein ABJO42_13245 [Ekhidna sp.]